MIAGVPTASAQTWAVVDAEHPLVVFSLLQHENKMSVVNFKLNMRRGKGPHIESVCLGVCVCVCVCSAKESMVVYSL